MNIKKIIFLLCFFPVSSFSEKIYTCFTPGQDCDNNIIKEINISKNEIDVMAYQLTDDNIINALDASVKKHVNVIVILDKSQKRNFYKYKSLKRNGAEIYIDYKPRISHNKIMIFDNKKVLTGSYNFTMSAQKKNAENYVIIDSAEISKKYKDYFNSRIFQSKEF